MHVYLPILWFCVLKFDNFPQVQCPGQEWFSHKDDFLQSVPVEIKNKIPVLSSANFLRKKSGR